MFADFELNYLFNILYLTLAVAAMVFFVLGYAKKEKILAAIRSDHKIRSKTLRSVLLGLGLLLMVFALMGPQRFTGYTASSQTGLDIYVLLDTSKSMLVSDLQPDRMSVAKNVVMSLLDLLEGDRIGFIPFAATAYIQMPLTDDYDLARMFLNAMDTDMMGGGGSNLAEGIRLANASFARSADADRVILIVSDGEENAGSSQEIMQSLTDEQLKIFTVGIGTEDGGLVPVYDNAGTSVIDYMKDETGNPHTSRLSAGTLIQLAEHGNGVYYQPFRQEQDTEISSLLEDLSDLKRAEMEAGRIKDFEPLYQFFLGAGILLFLIGWFMPEMRLDA